MTGKTLSTVQTLALLAAPVLAQVATPGERDVVDLFSQSVDVRVVNVDVTVTDRKGRPVTDLDEQDFVLYVDGREAAIAYFAGPEPRTGTTAPPAAGAKSAPSAAHPETPTAAPRGPNDDLLVVLFLDHSWLRGADRDRLLDDLEAFVAAQPPGKTRFLIATHDPGLTVRSPITSDLTRVREVLAGLADAPTQGYGQRRERSATFHSIQTIYQAYEDNPFCTPCDCGWEQMVAVWETFAQGISHRMEVSQRSVSDLVSALSGLPERKAIVYVTAGLEQRPGLDVLQFLAELCPLNERDVATRVLTYDESKPLLDLGALANAGRVTFYPLDAGGLRADSAATVEWADAKFRPSGLISRIERENYQASLQMLASETGGRAILNANQPLDRLLGLDDDFRGSYSLGFQPLGDADGRNHDLRVELREKARGMDVRYRRSFVDRPLERRLVDRAIAAVTFGEERNPLAVDAGLGEATVLARNVISIPVHVAVRPEHLVLVPSVDGGSTGRFRVFLAARSTSGARTVLRDKLFDLDPSEAASETVRLVVTMNLEPGDYTVAVGVRDEIGGETSYLTLDTTDPADQVEAPAGEGAAEPVLQS